MTFMKHDASVIAKMKHRRKLLTFLMLSVLLMLAIVPLSYFPILYYDKLYFYDIIFDSYEALCSVAFAILLYLAMNHIGENQKKL